MSKRQFRVLYQDFLRRIVDVEVLSVHARGDASTLIGQFISLLIFLSLLFSIPAIYFDGKLAMPGQAFLFEVWSVQHFLIATSMLLVGLFAVLTWNSVFPDKRDLMILAPLPVRTRTLFLAKIAAVGTALGLLLITLHVLAGIVWPFAFNRYVPAQMLQEFASQPAIPPVRASNMQAADGSRYGELAAERRLLAWRRFDRRDDPAVSGECSPMGPRNRIRYSRSVR